MVGGDQHVGQGEIEIKKAIPRANEKFTSTIALEHKKGLQKGRITMECTFIVENKEKKVSESVQPEVATTKVTPNILDFDFANDKKTNEKPSKLSSSHGAPVSTRPTVPRPSSAKKLAEQPMVEAPKGEMSLENGNDQKRIEPDLVKMEKAECTIPAATKVMSLRIQKLQIRDAVNTGNSFDPQDLAVRIKIGDKTLQTAR
jgi:hypothetical protein